MRPRLSCLCFAVLLCIASVACADMARCFDATVRVNSGNALGTGCIIEIDREYAYVLTNGHVVTQNAVQIEFWRRGHISQQVPGSVVLRSNTADVAVIAVPTSVFGGCLPPVIPLAPPNYEVKAGQSVFSVGCASGAWATAFRGNIRGYTGEFNEHDIMFDPPPANGRSGSAMFDECGTKIVGLIYARVEGGPGERPTATGPQGERYGLAINLQRIYAAIYGSRVNTDFYVADREVFWPPADVQCGPRGCPTPPGQVQPPRGQTPPFLPWRRQQEEKDRQQDDRNGEQDRRMDELFPSLPREEFKPPQQEVPPAETPKVEPAKPVQAEYPVKWLVWMCVVAALVGAVAGLVVQWRKTYRNK